MYRRTARSIASSACPPAGVRGSIFGWLVEAGVTSNSVLYVKDGATVGIGTGEQDRVGVAEIARDKAYRKLADWIAWEKHATPYNDLVLNSAIRAGASWPRSTKRSRR